MGTRLRSEGSGADDQRRRDLVVPTLVARVEGDPDHAGETECEGHPQTDPAHDCRQDSGRLQVIRLDHLETEQSHAKGSPASQVRPEDQEVDKRNQDRAAGARGHLLTLVGSAAARVVIGDDQVWESASYKAEEEGVDQICDGSNAEARCFDARSWLAGPGSASRARRLSDVSGQRRMGDHAGNALRED